MVWFGLHETSREMHFLRSLFHKNDHWPKAIIPFPSCTQTRTRRPTALDGAEAFWFLYRCCTFGIMVGQGWEFQQTYMFRAFSLTQSVAAMAWLDDLIWRLYKLKCPKEHLPFLVISCFVSLKLCTLFLQIYTHSSHIIFQ